VSAVRRPRLPVRQQPRRLPRSAPQLRPAPLRRRRQPRVRVESRSVIEPDRRATRRSQSRSTRMPLRRISPTVTRSALARKGTDGRPPGRPSSGSAGRERNVCGGWFVLMSGLTSASRGGREAKSARLILLRACSQRLLGFRRTEKTIALWRSCRWGRPLPRRHRSKSTTATPSTRSLVSAST
jgi:hypothetical protein